MEYNKPRRRNYKRRDNYCGYNPTNFKLFMVLGVVIVIGSLIGIVV